MVSPVWRPGRLCRGGDMGRIPHPRGNEEVDLVPGDPWVSAPATCLTRRRKSGTMRPGAHRMEGGNGRAGPSTPCHQHRRQFEGPHGIAVLLHESGSCRAGLKIGQD